MTEFLIAGTQRTGTTLMVTLLDSHPDILCVGESFNLGNNQNIYHQEYSYVRHCRKSIWQKLMHILGRDKLVEEYLNELYSNPEYKAIGFKYMQSHTRRFPMVVPYILKNNIRVIHVTRENELKVLVSLRAAQARGSFHSYKEVEAKSINIPVDGLLDKLNKIQRNNNYWANTFEGSVPYLKVSYESLQGNRDFEVDRIMKFLGMDFCRLNTPLVKMNPTDLSLVVENYNEVSNCLVDTEFSHCLMN